MVGVVRSSGHCRVTANIRRLANPLEVVGQGGAPEEEVDGETVEDPPAEVGETGPEETHVEEVTTTESSRKGAEDVGEVEENYIGKTIEFFLLSGRTVWPGVTVMAYGGPWHLFLFSLQG